MLCHPEKWIPASYGIFCPHIEPSPWPVSVAASCYFIISLFLEPRHLICSKLNWVLFIKVKSVGLPAPAGIPTAAAPSAGWRVRVRLLPFPSYWTLCFCEDLCFRKDCFWYSGRFAWSSGDLREISGGH